MAEGKCSFKHPNGRNSCQFHDRQTLFWSKNGDAYCEFHLPKTGDNADWENYFSSNGSYEGFHLRLKTAISTMAPVHGVLNLSGIRCPNNINPNSLITNSSQAVRRRENGENEVIHTCSYGLDMSGFSCGELVITDLSMAGPLILDHSEQSDILLARINASSISGDYAFASDRIRLERCSAESYSFNHLLNEVSFEMADCRHNNCSLSLTGNRLNHVLVKELQGANYISLRKSSVRQSTEISAEPARIGAGFDATSAVFFGSCKISGVRFDNSSSLENCVFHRAPDIRGCDVKNFSVLENARFYPSANNGDSGLYFELASIASTVHNRPLQGRFISLANRSELLSGASRFVRRLFFVSFWYWLLSDYGTNYKRPFFWLLALLATSSLFFAGMETGLRLSEPNFDLIRDGFIWSLKQTVNPFHYLKQPDGISLDLAHSLLSVFVSLISLILVALALLAIRWRFRRE